MEKEKEFNQDKVSSDPEINNVFEFDWDWDDYVEEILSHGIEKFQGG
ncbi:MAG: hypothetical protein ABIJ37_09950 [Pseudomonadota bacterium]